jgi:hypothetical protein
MRLVVHVRDDVERAAALQPGVRRGVLEHHHSRQRPPLAPPPMRSALLGLGRQTAQLEHALRPCVGERELGPSGIGAPWIASWKCLAVKSK